MSHMKKGSTVAGMVLWHSGNMRLLFEVARAQGLINDKSVTGDWVFNGPELIYQEDQKVISLTSTRIELNSESQFIEGAKLFGDLTFEKISTASNVGLKLEHSNYYGLEFRDGNVNVSGDGGILSLGLNSSACKTSKVIAGSDFYTEDGSTKIFDTTGRVFDLGERVYSPSNPPPIVSGSNRLTNSGCGSGEGGRLTSSENLDEIPVQSWTFQFDNFEQTVKGTLPPGVIDSYNALFSFQRHRGLEYQVQLAFVGNGGIQYRPSMLSAWDQIITQSLGNRLYSNLNGSYDVDFVLNSLQLASHESSMTKFMTEIRETGTDVVIKSDGESDKFSLRIFGSNELEVSKGRVKVLDTLEASTFLYNGLNINDIYLGIRGTAVNSDKLGNVEYNRYARNDLNLSEVKDSATDDWWNNVGYGNSYYLSTGAGSASSGFVYKIGGKDNSVWIAADDSGEMSLGISRDINSAPVWNLMLSRSNAERDFLGINAHAVSAENANKLGGKTPSQIQSDYDKRFLAIDAKAVSAADSDNLGGITPKEYSRAVLLPQVVSRTLNTAEFIQYLREVGAFSHNHWIGRATWNFDNNYVVDTKDSEVGLFHLAGSTIEVTSRDFNFYTVRIILASTSNNINYKSGCTVVFSDNGTGVDEGWWVEYSSKNKPTVADIADAVRKSGDAELGNMIHKSGFGPTGVLTHSGGYLTLNPYDSSYGSTGSRFRSYFKLHDANKPDVLNPGLVFSAHNTDGSAVDMNIWLNGKKVYHEGNKPTASELGLLKNTTDTLNGGLTVANASSHITIRETDASDKEWVLEGQNGDFCLTEKGVSTRLRAKAGGEFEINGSLTTANSIASMSGSSYKITSGAPTSESVSSFFRNDNTNFYLMFTDPGLADGWVSNSLRPISVDLRTGDLVLGHKVGIRGELQLSSTLNHASLNHSNKQVLNADANSVYLGSRDGVTNINLQTSTGQVMVSHGSNNHRVYHQGYKPTFNDVGAIAADNGSATGVLSISGTVLPRVTPSANASNYSKGLYLFENAAATSEFSQNSTILGVSSDSPSRHAQLEFNSNGNQVRFRAASVVGQNGWQNWNTFYHTGNKPTPADIGSLASTGGILTGGVTINSATDGQLILNSTDSSHVYTIYKHNGVTRGHLGIDNNANLVYASYDSTGNRVLGYGLSINPDNHTVTLNGDLTLDGTSKSIKTAIDVTILRDQGNGNVTLSASKNSSGAAGDLYLGYSAEGHWTRQVRLESKMDWKASHNIISEAGLVNSDRMYGNRADQFKVRGSSQFDSLIGTSEGVGGGSIILGAGESLPAILKDTPQGTEQVLIGGDLAVGVTFFSGLQSATSTTGVVVPDAGMVTVENGGIKVYGQIKNNNDWSKSATLSINTDEVFLLNSKSNKSLQLKDDGTLLYSGSKIYHEGHKPTPAEIGAMPVSGGGLDGDLHVNGSIDTNQGGYGVRLVVGNGTAYLQGGKRDSSLTDQKMMLTGYNNKPLTKFDIQTKGDNVATINDAKIYTEKNKPSKADVQLDKVENLSKSDATDLDRSDLYATAKAVNDARTLAFVYSLIM